MKVTSERFGRRVAEALGSGPGRSTLASQRARVLALARAGVPARTGRRWAVAVAAVVVVAIFIVWLRSPGSLSADFGDQPVAESALLEPRATAEALSFSDGSSMLLAPQTRLKLAKLSEAEVKLELTRGHVSAAIEKGRRWSIDAGPYSVRVVGTRFTVDYAGDLLAITVRVEEGRVAVRHAAGNEVLLGPGMVFERKGTLATNAGGAPTAVPRHEVEHAPAPAMSAASDAAAATGRAEPTWSMLANRGKYREALALAERQGFDGLLLASNESELLLLANTARYAGDREKAQRAFLSIRQRFASRPGAALSAFYLARIAEDKDRNLGEAARWLRTFLEESPSGDLAASARASLIGILSRSGDHAGARTIATEYLKRHPDGPHAAEARALLDQRPRE